MIWQSFQPHTFIASVLFFFQFLTLYCQFRNKYDFRFSQLQQDAGLLYVPSTDPLDISYSLE